MLSPLNFQWTGDAMVPTAHSRRLIDQHFVIGENYQFVTHEERSLASHKHYWAVLTEAWQNLPEAPAADFPTVDHARKRALIMTGHSTIKDYVCKTGAEALRMAAVIKELDEYCVTQIDGCIVRRMTAKSQSMRAMGKAVFQKSKDDVLAYLARIGGYDAGELGRAA